MHFLAVIATAYCLTGTTASGAHTGPGVVAVDPRVIALGTRLDVPGYGRARALDTGADIRGNRIDVFIASCKQARRFGVRRLVIRVFGR